MKVAIIMGSKSDFEVIKDGIDFLKDFGISYEVRALSAHRTPDELEEYMAYLEKENVDVIIGAAGKAAHLPGVIASKTTLPVIGLPIKSSTMDGLDSLLSIVQMPKGIPVATVAINGSLNSAILATQIMSLKYPILKEKLKDYKKQMAKKVIEDDMYIKSDF